MPGWLWALIVVGAAVLLALLVWQALRARRTRMLRERFGPEYDRALEGAENKQAAESELSARAERRDELEIRPLRPGARERFVADWQRVQARFVDDPEDALRDADMLIQSVMSARGYPVDDFEQRAADISVDHPQVVEEYRAAHRVARASALGDATTEELRQAMRQYRSLFDELVEEAAEAPLDRERAAADADAARR
jgi:cytoskeletal protein RodZ